MKSNTNCELVKELTWEKFNKIKGSFYTAQELKNRELIINNYHRINYSSTFVVSSLSGHDINVFLPKSFTLYVGRIFLAAISFSCYKLIDIQT